MFTDRKLIFILNITNIIIFKSKTLQEIKLISIFLLSSHQFPEKIIPKFTCLLHRGEKLIIHGDGSPTRRYLYGGDAADAFDFVLNKGVVGQIYNVGSEAEVANIDLCKLLLKEFNRPCGTEEEIKNEIVFVKDRPFNDHRYAVDGGKLKQLGWTQNTPFMTGLATTVAWYRVYGECWWGNIGAALTAYPVSVNTSEGKAALQAN